MGQGEHNDFVSSLSKVQQVNVGIKDSSKHSLNQFYVREIMSFIKNNNKKIVSPF